MQPGQAADARFELWWRWNGRDIIGQRAWDIDLTIREVSEVAPGQYRFGQEHALQFKGVAVGNMTSAAPAGGCAGDGFRRSGAARRRPLRRPRPAAPATGCRPISRMRASGRCVASTPARSSAEILTATATREQSYARPWHTVSMNIRFRNKTTEPIILGYVVPTGVLIDDLGNRYAPAGAPNDAKGIGKVQANKRRSRSSCCALVNRARRRSARHA